MRILVLDHGYRRYGDALRALFVHHACFVDFADPLDSPEDVERWVEYASPAAILVAPDCMESFRQAAIARDKVCAITFDCGDLSDLDPIFCNVAAHAGYESPILRYGDITLDLSEPKKCLQGEEEVSLRPQEYMLLRYLMLNVGAVCTCEDIYFELYATPDDRAESENTIFTLIYGLRKKLALRDVLQTVWGQGYMLNLHTPVPDFQAGAVCFYPDGSVTWDGQGVKLQPNDKKLLRFFLENRDKIFTMQSLFDALYQGKDRKDLPKTRKVYFTAINKAIAEVSKSDTAPYGLKVIRKIPGKGYRWDPQPVKPAFTIPVTPLILRWYDGYGQLLLEIDTKTKMMTNLQTEKSVKLGDRECEAVSLAYACTQSGLWQKQQGNAQIWRNSINVVRHKICTLFPDKDMHPERFIMSRRGSSNDSEGYALNLDRLNVVDLSEELQPDAGADLIQEALAVVVVELLFEHV